jgi:FAD/FMN-containing dehydrogenase
MNDTNKLTDDLRAALHGRVVTPEDTDYDQLRTVMAGSVDRRPAAIARVVDANDVQAVVRIAREHGAELAVRSGGHDGLGRSVSEGGVVLDLREMKGLEIDSVARTAWAETGLTAAEVVTAAAEHGLVIGFGDTGSVGIGGITLGGGIGYQVRKHGLTIDNLVAAEVVTADGKLVRADSDEHPDLFWAIRGGGGNFGVVTRFQYRLNPLPGFVGGILILPATAQTVAGFMRLSAAAPDELSTIANVMNCPPMPFVPEEHHGSLVIMAMLGWTGDEAAGHEAIAPFRALATPLADMVKPMPYPEMYAAEGEPGDYRPLAVTRNLYINEVDEAMAQTIVDALAASDAPLRAVQLRALGGAMARVPADATAFGHRDAPVMAQVVSFYTGPDDAAAREAWVVHLTAAIDQGRGGGYVNFIEAEGEAGLRLAYPAPTLSRLAQIKQKYDPTNLFRLNLNIPPTA